MKNFNEICSFAGQIEPLVIIVSAIIALISVIVAVIALLADHKRRRRQATFDFFQRISDERFRLRFIIKDIFKDNEDINPNDQRYKKNKELRRIVTRFLVLHECLAVGINFRVFDMTVFMQIAGKTTIRWYDRMKPVIEYRRVKKNNLLAFKNYEVLVNKMRKYDKQRK